jgi:alanine racemase
MLLLQGMRRPTWAEVDLSAIRDNIRSIRARVGRHVKIMPAVKADAYGHGAVPVSRTCLEAGADALGVACVEEGIELREAGIRAPILILGCSEPEAADEIVRYDIASTCCDERFAKALSESAVRQGKTAAVHVKIDTGMGRIGVFPEDAAPFFQTVAALPGIALEGIFTHFACSDEADRSFTLYQISTFAKVVTALKRQGFTKLIAHASNSGGILGYPESDFDAVRPGIMIYGHYPSASVPASVPVREALTLKSRIVFLKQVKAGNCVSYGRTCRLERNSIVATLPIGYADGYSRSLSNVGEAVVRGFKVPVIGRVCMDQILIDVTDVPSVRLGDEVILYGGGYDFLSVTKIAEKIGTISYELLCNIGKRVPRIYV